ncbi:FAD binding domain-containing protein, partial [Klebsiella pneumoniae]|nr:FAD binding domain-containing protein [Klebsiella pneumoniae]
VNEGRLTEGTLVRVTDPAFRQMNLGGPRIELGAGVTMAMVLARGELAFLHPAARSIGGPAVRTMASLGGNLFAGPPYGDFTVALLALDAQVV